MSTTGPDSSQRGFGGASGGGGLRAGAEAGGELGEGHGIEPIAATFRRMLWVAFLVFVFAVVQMFVLWRVCDSGMKTATSLQRQGPLTLNAVNDFSAKQANETFDSFSRIQIYAILFCGGNVLLAFGAVAFVRLAARRSRAQLADNLSRLDQRTRELAGTLSAVNATLEATADGILLIDAEGRIANFNRQYARIWGLTEPEEMKKDRERLKAHVVAQAKNSEGLAAKIEELAAHPERESCEVWELKDGRFLEAFSRPQRIGDRICGRVWSIRDITERRRAQEELRRSREEFKDLFDNAAVGFHEVDAEGRLVRINNTELKMLGYSAEELLGQFVWKISMEEETSRRAALAKLAGEAPPPQGFVRTFRRKDGSGFPVLISDRLLKGAGGRIIGIRAAVQDITERKRDEEALASEQGMLNRLISAIPDVVYFKDRESRFIRINEGFARRFGLGDPSAAVGKTDFDLFGSEHASQAFADEQRIIATGQAIIDTEEREDWKDGRVTWVSSTKMPLLDKNGRIIGIMGLSRDITERKRAEESLRLLGSALEQAEDSIHITDAQLDLPGPRIMFVNPAFTKMTGYTAEEVLGKTPRLLQGARTDKAVRGRLRAALTRGEGFHGEVINYRKDGTEFHAEIHIGPIRDGKGAITHYVSIKRDITERRRFEERLFQSQKMETVGKLAGGVAHEFNSIMTAILGQSELMLFDLPEGNPLRKSASEIHHAADRAAILTRQLLAYGRKQMLQPDVLDLNTVLAGMENTLRHIAGRDVDVHIAASTGPKLVKADPGQIEQVIVNIVMNAAEAMPHGGKLTLETAEAFLDQQYVSRFADLKAGNFVMVAITDTGAGMSETVKARVFEPFFTTKEVGKGTGLGLATCHGIIKQSDGHINVYSEPGRGATFKIYLPKVQLEAKAPGPPLRSPGMPRGTETILLVEDDPALRQMAATLLERLGYTVLTAGNGLEALNVTHQRTTGHIDLLFTDVVMPHMSGKELADRVRSLYPQTNILFTSAYTENAFIHQGVLQPGIALLQKPFTPSTLAAKVREVLDSDKPAAASR